MTITEQLKDCLSWISDGSSTLTLYYFKDIKSDIYLVEYFVEDKLVVLHINIDEIRTLHRYILDKQQNYRSQISYILSLYNLYV